MEALDLEEIAGRVEGLARALLHTVAVLEMQQVIDGPQLAQSWREALPLRPAPGLATARTTLLELAQSLDDARAHRQSRGPR